MVKQTLIYFLLLSFVSACSSESCDELVLDTFKHHDYIKVSGKNYYLYSRTTGWHEKVVFFELYEKKPTFDKCMRSDINPIYARPFDDTESLPYIKKLILMPEQPEKLRIIYTKEAEEGVGNIYDVKFSK